MFPLYLHAVQKPDYLWVFPSLFISEVFPIVWAHKCLNLHSTVIIINAGVLFWPLTHAVFIFIYQYLDHPYISHPHSMITSFVQTA